MRPTITFSMLLGILLSGPTRSPGDEAAIGLSLVELRDPRDFRDAPAWFPDVSANVRRVLLQSDDATVVQLVLYPDGQCYDRDATDVQLRRVDGASRDDYVKLVRAMDDDYFRTIRRIVQVSAYAASSDAFGGVGQQLFAVRTDLEKARLTASQKEHLDARVGQAVARIPEVERAELLRRQGVGPELARSLDTARRLERTGMDQITAGTAGRATDDETKEVARHLIGPPGHAIPDGAALLRPSKDNSGVFVLDATPSTRIYIKPKNEATARQFKRAPEKVDLGGLIKSNRVDVYMNQGVGSSPRRLDSEAIGRQLKDRKIEARVVAPRF